MPMWTGDGGYSAWEPNTKYEVRAKFKCNSITIFEGESREYSFSPVYGTDGSLKMTINNPECFDKFETGEEYYVDFTKAEKMETTSV